MMPEFKHCPVCGGALENRLHEEKERLVCSACGYVFYQNSKLCTAVLVEKEGKLMMTRRAVEPFKDLWDLPGGFLEDGEHPEAGAKRELKEETGIDVEIVELLEVYMDTYGETGINTLNFLYLAHPVAGEAVPKSDVSEVRWFLPDEIPDVIAFENCRVAVEKWKKRIKSLETGGQELTVSSGEKVEAGDVQVVTAGDSKEEIKKKIAEALPDEFYLGAKSSRRRSFAGCFNVIATFLLIMLFVSLYLLFRVINFLQNDLVSGAPITRSEIKIPEKEIEDLEQKINEYNKILKQVSDSKEASDFEIVLTGNQVNYLMEKKEEEYPVKDFTTFRIFPIKDKAELHLAIPFNRKKKNFINAIMNGKFAIRDYFFSMELDSLETGKRKNIMILNKHFKRRIEKDLKLIPENFKVPFVIKSLIIKDSKLNLHLMVKPH